MLCAQTSLVWASLLQWPLDCLSQTRAFDQTTIVIVEQQKSIENPLGSTANASLLRAARVVPSLSKPHLSTAFQLNYLECVRNYVLSGISTIHIFDHRFIFEINKRFFFQNGLFSIVLQPLEQMFTLLAWLFEINLVKFKTMQCTPFPVDSKRCVEKHASIRVNIFYFFKVELNYLK